MKFSEGYLLVNCFKISFLFSSLTCEDKAFDDINGDIDCICRVMDIQIILPPRV